MRSASTQPCCRGCSSLPKCCARVSDAGAAATGLPRRHADRRRRRRPGGRRRRHGHHAARHRERHARHVGRCLCRDRSAVPRSGGRLHTFCHAIPGSLARHGRHAGGRPVAAMAPRSVGAPRMADRRGYDETDDRSGGAVPAGGRRRALGAVSHGRAHAAPRSERARRARRPCRQPHARARRPRGARRRRVQPARFVHDLRRAGPPGRRRCGSAAAARGRRCGARSRPTFTASDVETVATEEGAGYGAALLAGVGAGFWHSVDDACDAVVRTAQVTPGASRSDSGHERVSTRDTVAYTPHCRAIYSPD